MKIHLNAVQNWQQLALIHSQLPGIHICIYTSLQKTVNELAAIPKPIVKHSSFIVAIKKYKSIFAHISSI